MKMRMMTNTTLKTLRRRAMTRRGAIEAGEDVGNIEDGR